MGITDPFATIPIPSNPSFMATSKIWFKLFLKESIGRQFRLAPQFGKGHVTIGVGINECHFFLDQSPFGVGNVVKKSQ